MSMRENRSVIWEGCVNVRDLGGLPTLDGRFTRFGSVIRSDHPRKLTRSGLRSLQEANIKTILELTTLHLESTESNEWDKPDGITHRVLPVEDFNDEEFRAGYASTGLWQTPLYFSFALKRWPHFYAQVIQAFVDSPPGGVLIHCGRGHDRTGLVVLCLLAIAGVNPKSIAEDYELSDPNMIMDERIALTKALGQASTTSRNVILDLLDNFDIQTHLEQSGMKRSVAKQVRARLIC